MGDSFDDNRIQKLFEHAIDSVEMGVEDYVASSEDQRRIMSSVRNVDSGLELLCKVYIGKDGVKAILDGNGDHTIGMRKIRNVLMNQKIMMEPFVALRGYRDNVEHFFPSDREVARQYLENSLSWMIEFMTKRLHRKPHEAFSPKIWDILCREQAIMQEERRKMEDEFSELDLPHPEMSGLAPYYFRCPDCRSMIVDVVKEKEGGRQFLCHHCGKQLSYDELVDSVYPNCICELCGEPLVMPEEMSEFSETCYCSKCNYDLSKDD